MKLFLFTSAAFFLIVPLAAPVGYCDESAAEKLIVTETIELMRGRDSNAFAAYSTVRKAWDSHRFPHYLTVKPWTLGEFGERASNAVVAFELADGPIERLVAVDIKGRFRTLELSKAIRRELRPTLNGESVISYVDDGMIYAFSGRTGTWDTLSAPHILEGQLNAGTGNIVVKLPQGTATFSPDRGFWKIEFDSKDQAITKGDEPDVGPETSKIVAGDG